MLLELAFVAASVRELDRALTMPQIVSPLARVDLAVKVDHPTTACLLVLPVPALVYTSFIEHRPFAVLSAGEIPLALVDFIPHIIELPLWLEDSLNAVRGWRGVV